VIVSEFEVYVKVGFTVTVISGRNTIIVSVMVTKSCSVLVPVVAYAEEKKKVLVDLDNEMIVTLVVEVKVRAVEILVCCRIEVTPTKDTFVSNVLVEKVIVIELVKVPTETDRAVLVRT